MSKFKTSFSGYNDIYARINFPSHLTTSEFSRTLTKKIRSKELKPTFKEVLELKNPEEIINPTGINCLVSAVLFDELYRTKRIEGVTSSRIGLCFIENEGYSFIHAFNEVQLDDEPDFGLIDRLRRNKTLNQTQYMQCGIFSRSLLNLSIGGPMVVMTTKKPDYPVEYLDAEELLEKSVSLLPSVNFTF